MRKIWSLSAILSCLLISSSAFADGASDALLKLPFEAGMNHVKGNYAFTNNNYLVEGAEKISSLGSPSIFIYMTNGYASDYPDKGQGLFGSPSNLTELASSAAYKEVFNLPFKMYVITVFTFANGSNIFRDQKSNADVYSDEYTEIYNLTKYLYATYAGTGKVFILKNWEGDWFAMRDTYDTSVSIPADNLADVTNWLKARQAAVAAARTAAGDPSDVAVLNATEVNRPSDYFNSGLNRLINVVVPAVKADMLTYSSYDTTIEGCGTDSAGESGIKTCLGNMLTDMSKLAADPLGLGTRRMLVSEYGLYENNHSAADNLARIEGVVSEAKSWGASGAMLWELYDNQCTAATKWSGGAVGSAAPIAANTGAAGRPTNSTCPGLWYIRPDGSTSTAAQTMDAYWGTAATTVTVSAPAVDGTYSSPVTVKATCTSSSAIDHLSVWVDGVKLGNVTGTRAMRCRPPVVMC